MAASTIPPLHGANVSHASTAGAKVLAESRAKRVLPMTKFGALEAISLVKPTKPADEEKFALLHIVHLNRTGVRRHSTAAGDPIRCAGTR
jgi:hypothetical protein